MIIVEGILVLAMPEVCELLAMKVFVDTDDDVRLARRSFIRDLLFFIFTIVYLIP